MIKIKIFKNETNAHFIKRFKKAAKFQRAKYREKEFFIKPNKRKEMSY